MVKCMYIPQTYVTIPNVSVAPEAFKTKCTRTKLFLFIYLLKIKLFQLLMGNTSIFWRKNLFLFIFLFIWLNLTSLYIFDSLFKKNCDFVLITLNVFFEIFSFIAKYAYLLNLVNSCLLFCKYHIFIFASTQITSQMLFCENVILFTVKMHGYICIKSMICLCCHFLTAYISIFILLIIIKFQTAYLPTSKLSSEI